MPKSLSRLSTTSTGKQRSMSLFKIGRAHVKATLFDLVYRLSYVGSYVLKSDMDRLDRCLPVDVGWELKSPSPYLLSLLKYNSVLAAMIIPLPKEYNLSDKKVLYYRSENVIVVQFHYV